ncbi:MAG: TraR/DksA C4-type zinc finger protein [Syntrophotaleaceae bacterium]
MRENKIAEIKKHLLARREELLTEFRDRSAAAAALIDQGVPDVGDMSLTDILQDTLHLLSESTREEIMRIDEALDRIENGEYGLCQSCGEPIATERLEIRPHARYCVDCKEELEREQAKKAPPEKGKL